MIRRYFSALACLLVTLSCGWELPTGKIESGSVRIICGQRNRPCHFHIEGPKELILPTVSLDGECVIPMFPSHIEHPYRTLLFNFLGLETGSDTAVATFHVPAGTHVLGVAQAGWQPIERTVVSDGSSKQMRLVLHVSDLRKAAR